MVDASRYEQGIEEFGKLFDEILHYMRETFLESRDFGKEISSIHFQLRKKNGKIFLDVHATLGGEQKVLMEKMILIVLNKQDILGDDEVAVEYTTHFLEHAKTYIKNTFGIPLDTQEIPVFMLSAMTKE